MTNATMTSAMEMWSTQRIRPSSTPARASTVGFSTAYPLGCWRFMPDVFSDSLFIRRQHESRGVCFADRDEAGGALFLRTLPAVCRLAPRAFFRYYLILLEH